MNTLGPLKTSQTSASFCEVCSTSPSLPLLPLLPSSSSSSILWIFKGPWRKLAERNSKIYKKVYGFAVPDGEPSAFDLYLYPLLSSPLLSSSLPFPSLPFPSLLFCLSFYHLTTARYDRGREKERSREGRGKAHAAIRAKVKGHLVKYPYSFLISELVCEEREREREEGRERRRRERKGEWEGWGSFLYVYSAKGQAYLQQDDQTEMFRGFEDGSLVGG